MIHPHSPNWPTHKGKAAYRRRQRAHMLALGSHHETPGDGRLMAEIARGLIRVQGGDARVARVTGAPASINVTGRRDRTGRATLSYLDTSVRLRWDADTWSCTACGRQAVPACEHARRVLKELAESDRKRDLKRKAWEERRDAWQARAATHAAVRIQAINGRGVLALVTADGEGQVRVRFEDRAWHCEAHPEHRDGSCVHALAVRNATTYDYETGASVA